MYWGALGRGRRKKKEDWQQILAQAPMFKKNQNPKLKLGRRKLGCKKSYLSSTPGWGKIFL